MIGSLSKNGALLCTNLAPGSVATVEWAPSVTGPWTNNWAGLDSVPVDSNGVIQVSVPMFYRVRGIPAPPPGMALVPAGSFTMGDTFSEGSSSERPTHSVYISPFYMDTKEVSQAQWDDVYQWAITNGYSFDNTGSGRATNHPVQQINWYDMVKWCNARSEKEEQVPAYYTEAAQTNVYRTGWTDVLNDWVKWTAGYRLPTEAEWEKAARGGTAGYRFPWAGTNIITHFRANYYSTYTYAYDLGPTRGYHPDYDDGDSPYTSPGGAFAANGYGLHDMAGNVWEWCWDWWDSSWYGNASATQDDTRGPAGPLDDRVLRGGNWGSIAYGTRCAFRGNRTPFDAYDYIGFRCARGL